MRIHHWDTKRRTLWKTRRTTTRSEILGYSCWLYLLGCTLIEGRRDCYFLLQIENKISNRPDSTVFHLKEDLGDFWQSGFSVFTNKHPHWINANHIIYRASGVECEGIIKRGVIQNAGIEDRITLWEVNNFWRSGQRECWRGNFEEHAMLRRGCIVEESTQCWGGVWKKAGYTTLLLLR